MFRTEIRNVRSLPSESHVDLKLDVERDREATERFGLRKSPKRSFLNRFQKRRQSAQQGDAADSLGLATKPIYSNNFSPGTLKHSQNKNGALLTVNPDLIVEGSPSSPSTEAFEHSSFAHFSASRRPVKRKREGKLRQKSLASSNPQNTFNPWDGDLDVTSTNPSSSYKLDTSDGLDLAPSSFGAEILAPSLHPSPKSTASRTYAEYNQRLSKMARKNSEAKKLASVDPSILQANESYNRSPLSAQQQPQQHQRSQVPAKESPEMYRVDPIMYNKQLNDRLTHPQNSSGEASLQQGANKSSTTEYLAQARLSIGMATEMQNRGSSSSSPKLSPRVSDSIYKRTAQIKRTQQKLKYYITRMLRVKARRTGRSEHEELLSCFRIFDGDRDGKISASDLQRGLKVLGAVMQLKDIEKMMKEYDDNDDGQIDFLEFLEMVLETSHPILTEYKLEKEQQQRHKEMMQKMARHYEFGESESLPSKSQLQVDDTLLVENVEDNQTVSELRSEIQRLLEQNTKLYDLSQSFKMTNDAYKLQLQQVESRLHTSEEHLAQEAIRLRELEEQQHQNEALQKRFATAHKRDHKSEYLQQKRNDIMSLAPLEDTTAEMPVSFRQKTETDFIEEQLRKERIKYDCQSLEHYTKACKLYTKKKYQLSKQYFQKCLAIVEDLEELNFRKRAIRCFHNIGLIYYFLRDYKDAVDYYEKALFIADDVQDDQIKCLTLSNLGIVYYTQKSYAEALQYLKQAVHIFESSDQQTDTHATCVSYTAWIFDISRLYAKAIKAHTKALQLYTQLKNTPGKAESHFRLGTEYLHENDFEASKRHFEAAMKLYQRMKKAHRKAFCLKGIGMCHRSLNGHSKALKFLKQALAQFKKLKSTDEECLCYFELGVAYKVIKSHDMALSYFQKCVSTARNMSDKSTTQGVCSYNMGMIYHAMIQKPNAKEDHTKLAMDNYKIALEYLVESRTVANVWHNIGSLEFNEREYDAAVEAFEKALALYKELRDQSAYEEVLKKISITLRHTGRPESALRRFEEGVELYVQGGADLVR